MYDRTRGNRRILVWEDRFCNFAASACGEQSAAAAFELGPSGSTSGPECAGEAQVVKGLQPELFFKMSHEIYNYGEGLIGKVAADQGHKWVFKEPQEQEINFLSSWNNPVDYYGSEMVAALWITEISSSPFLHMRELLKEIGYRDTDLNLVVDVEGTEHWFLRDAQGMLSLFQSQGSMLQYPCISILFSEWNSLVLSRSNLRELLMTYSASHFLT